MFTLDNTLFPDSWDLSGKYLTYSLVSVAVMDAFAKIILDMGDCYAVSVWNFFLLGFVLFSFIAYSSWGIFEGI